MADVREAEKAITASKAAAEMANNSSKEAKVIGEKAAKDITSLVKVKLTCHLDFDNSEVKEASAILAHNIIKN